MHLVLGGIRSGKSAFAQQQVLSSGKLPVYLATAQALDGEMQQRIQRHQADRGEQWQLIEEPLLLAQALRENDDAKKCIVVDCLTLWLTNLLMAEEKREHIVQRELDALFAQLPQLRADIIFVSNEVGFGVMPMGELTRRFCDEAGFLHQRLAQLCDRVSLVVAGIPMQIK